MGGGYDILITKENSRTHLEVAHSGPMHCEQLKLLSSAKVYIRPIQQNLSLEVTESNNEATIQCMNCGAAQPASQLRAHIRLCKVSLKY